jgi:multidrug resistance efflux pump
MSDLTQPPHVPSCVSTGEGVTVPDAPATPRTDEMCREISSLPSSFGAQRRRHYLKFARTLERELSSAQAALAAAKAEVANLLWNLAGCDTLAMGYSEPCDYSKELARPALHSVSKLRQERDQLRARVAAMGKDLERFTAGGLLNVHAICDQRDSAVSRVAELEAENATLKVRFTNITTNAKTCYPAKGQP